MVMQIEPFEIALYSAMLDAIALAMAAARMRTAPKNAALQSTLPGASLHRPRPIR